MPVAAAAWAASAAAVRVEASQAGAAALALLGAAVLLLVLALVLHRLGASRKPGTGRRSLNRHVPAHRLATVLIAAVVPLGAGAAVFTGAAVAGDAQVPPAMQLPAGDSADAAVVMRVGSEPRAAGTDRFTGAPRYLLEAQAERLTLAGKTYAVDAPLLVGGTDDLAGLRPGTLVRAVGGLRAAEGGGRERFVLEVRAPPAQVDARKQPNSARTHPDSVGTQSDTARSGPADEPRPEQDRAGAGPNWAESLQERFAEQAGTHPAAGARAAGLLPGMVLGDRTRLDPVLEEQMKDTGLTHLTAVSGSNCGYVLAAGYLLARLLRWPRPAATAAALALLAAFVALVGPDPSVLRAAVMGATGALAMLSGRGRTSLALLCLAVVLLLAADPWLGVEYGFILSVLATGSLIVLGPRLAVAFSTVLPYPAAALLAVPVAAQLGCAPVLVLLQPDVPVYSVAANLLAAPAVPAATLAGMAALVLDPLPLVPVVPLALALAASGWVAGVAGFFATLPASTLPWPAGLPGAALMAVACAATVAVLLLAAGSRLRGRQPGNRNRPGGGTPPGPGRERARRRLLLPAAAACLAGAVIALLPGPWRPDPAAGVPGDWLAAVCDVGQGDAILLRSGPASAVLVDTGPEPEAVGRCLSRLRISRLDLVVLTHAHADHHGGLVGAAAGREVGRVMWSAADGEPPGTARGVGPAEAASIRDVTDDRRAEAGQSGVNGLVAWEVLWPPAGYRPAEENDASLVLLARVGVGTGSEVSMLLTGDLEEDAARSLLARHRVPLAEGVDILKVAHHGARNGGMATIEALRPALAVVSVGAENTYGHPAPEILAGLERVQAKVARTDLLGTLIIAPAGKGGLRVLALDSG